MSGSANFNYNCMLASALAQLLPAQERTIIRTWLDRLRNVTDADQIVIRNDYMWFLLLALKNRKIVAPFTKMPLDTDLIPLKQILPLHIYYWVLCKSVAETNLGWIDHLMAKEKEEFEEPPRAPTVSTGHPSQFLKNQPIPRRGVFCYMGAFSDQNK